jgi:uncharacterized protein YbjT (DUF2867 family)
MSTILITGGNGGLGRELVARLDLEQHQVRIMSRGTRPETLAARIEWAQADVENGDGLTEAVDGVDVIVNAMSNPQNMQAVDIDGTGRLLAAAKRAGVGYVLHISIVGIDRIPTPYYQAKVAAERVVSESSVPYSIWRGTQFHTLLDGNLAPLRTADTAPILSRPPETQFQLLDTGEAADTLLPLINAAPSGLLPDYGGPEVLTLDTIIRMWLDAQGLERPIQYVPGEPAVSEAFRQGYNTAPNNTYGSITWADYLRQRYG